MSPATASIGIVLASPEDFELLEPARALLERLQCPCQTFTASVWASPERLLGWAERSADAGIKVIVAAAGSEPQLPGFLAAASRLPVIAVPRPASTGDECLSLALRTSPAAPVAAVAPGDALSAALLAVRVLAVAEPGLARVLEEYRQTLVRDLDDQAGLWPEAERASPRGKTAARPAAPNAPSVAARTAFRPDASPAPEAPKFAGDTEESVEIRPAHLDRPLTGQPPRAAEPKTAPLPLKGARVIGRRRIDSDAPDVELIEEAVDCLLEGGVIALPTDTVYGVAADATNPAAVEMLFELKGRSRNKAIVLLVDSPKLLAGIACNLTVEARRLMEAFWPGPLTIIFQKRPGNFTHVSTRDTIGVRLPDHSVPLAIMQALGRPLACTSANLAGEPEALAADQIEAAFGNQLNLILDGGVLSESPPSTVVDMTGEPYKILRQGALSYDQLAALVGDKLEPEA